MNAVDEISRFQDIHKRNKLGMYRNQYYCQLIMHASHNCNRYANKRLNLQVFCDYRPLITEKQLQISYNYNVF